LIVLLTMNYVRNLRKSYSLFLAYSSAELVSSSNQCAKYKHFLSIIKVPFFTTLPFFRQEAINYLPFANLQILKFSNF
ncbi:hypothetical protein, partial [Bergeyella zoohelcum]|uniref:hypothetical protein n=1 Tax=Bergeyella zoohelcum TaxID=1015 RepID=UPI001C8839D1